MNSTQLQSAASSSADLTVLFTCCAEPKGFLVVVPSSHLDQKEFTRCMQKSLCSSFSVVETTWTGGRRIESGNLAGAARKDALKFQRRK